MRYAAYVGASILTLSLMGGCMLTQSDEATPATLTSVSLSQKASIAEVISAWYGGIDITLADNVFTDSSELSIERKVHKDDRGLPIEGRHDNPVFTFSLLKQGEKCVLRNNQTGETQVIEGLSCKSSDV